MLQYLNATVLFVSRVNDNKQLEKSYEKKRKTKILLFSLFIEKNLFKSTFPFFEIIFPNQLAQQIMQNAQK